MPVRTLGPKGGLIWGAVPHRLEEGKSVSEDVGPRRSPKKTISAGGGSESLHCKTEIL